MTASSPHSAAGAALTAPLSNLSLTSDDALSPSAAVLPSPPPVSASPPLPPTASTSDSLQRFLSLQEERAMTYHRWEAGFRQYLDSRQEAELQRYTALCQQVTKQFSAISLAVKLIISHLQSMPASASASSSSSSSPSPASLASLLRSVQDSEREKLRLTIAMQELSSHYVVVLQQPFHSQYHAEMSELRLSMLPVVENINDALTELRIELRYRKRQQP